MMISVFNCKKCLWKNLKLASMVNDRTCLTDEYRFGTSVFPIVDLDCDRVNRVLIFGGINVFVPNLYKVILIIEKECLNDIF